MRSWFINSAIVWGLTWHHADAQSQAPAALLSIFAMICKTPPSSSKGPLSSAALIRRGQPILVAQVRPQSQRVGGGTTFTRFTMPISQRASLSEGRAVRHPGGPT